MLDPKYVPALNPKYIPIPILNPKYTPALILFLSLLSLLSLWKGETEVTLTALGAKQALKRGLAGDVGVYVDAGWGSRDGVEIGFMIFGVILRSEGVRGGGLQNYI